LRFQGIERPSLPSQGGIAAVVAQQFEVAAQIAELG
jgi:hypothetical protein